MLGITTTNARVGGFRGGKKFSAEALAWETNIIANGGTIPAATLTIFDEVFFKPAKANGNILTELDRLNIYAGLVGYEIAARTNIIKSAHYVTPVSSPTFDNNGYKSSGTSYLNLNYNPSTQPVKLSRNSLTHGIVFKNPVYTGTKRSMGVITGGAAQRLEIYVAESGTRAIANSSNSFITNSSAPSGYVHVVGKRVAASGANASENIVNGVITYSTVASAALSNDNVFELTTNFGGPVGDYDTNYHLASFHGSKDLDNASLRTILDNLFTALGV